MHKKQCQNCNKTFPVYDRDLEFYERIDVPAPTWCPDCRNMRRLAFRNERILYSRKCDSCKKDIISVYHPKTKYAVYCSDCWWGDSWNPLDYGFDFDFSRTFFNQFGKLMEEVPRLAIINKESENSEYTNICARNKNCYMIIESSDNEDCLFSYWIQKSKDLADCSFCHECELSYECNNCYQCFNLKYSHNCKGCNSSLFMENCSGCSDCLGCVNLINKKYHIFNKKYYQADYEKYLNNLNIKKFKEEFKKFSLKQPKKFAEINKSENCTGNYLENSKNCYQCFHAHEAENCRYGVHVWRQAKDCMDTDTSGMKAELIYESINTAINVYNNKFCNRCWTNHDLEYCDNLDNSNSCFGCTGLRHAQFCIFNKQYSEKSYSQLKAKIIKHMKKMGEYGEFFPVKISPFAYNETAANDYFPFSKEDILAKNWKWQEKSHKKIDKKFPICQSCQKNYKLIEQEIKFYKKQNLPIPDRCPTCRHIARLKMRSAPHLWHRQCMCTQPDHDHSGRCPNEFETTYSPERKELVYCEDCYNKEIY